MRHNQILLILLSISTILITAKPVFGPIGVAQKHKIAKMIENEQKSLQVLEEEQALLERVVETLSKEIEDKENHIEKLRSFTHGETGIVGGLYDTYRANFQNSAASRPGR